MLPGLTGGLVFENVHTQRAQDWTRVPSCGNRISFSNFQLRSARAPTFPGPSAVQLRSRLCHHDRRDIRR